MDTSRNTATSGYHFLPREVIIELLEQRDSELREKNAELARKSRRILELERTLYGRRSEKHLPESAMDWTGTLFDEQWAKEGSLAQVEAMPLINEIKQQAGQRRKTSRRKSRPSRKGKAYAAYVPEDIERQVTEIPEFGIKMSRSQ